MLKKVEIIDIVANEQPKFVESITVKYQREGEAVRSWEMVKRHASVHAMVYNKTTDEFLLVKQYRIPVLLNDYDEELAEPGVVYEACAGLIDSDSEIDVIVQNEILEELGYAIELDQIIPVKFLKSSVGLSGADALCFYVEVTEDQRVSAGGGLPGEDIEVVRIPYDELFEFIYDAETTTDAVTMFLAMHGYSMSKLEVLKK